MRAFIISVANIDLLVLFFVSIKRSESSFGDEEKIGHAYLPS